VIVGGIVFFQQSQLSNAVTDTARAAVGISAQARALYQNQRNFGDNEDLTIAMIRAGVVPSNFIDATGDAIAHPFGGSMAVTGNGDGFVISYSDISQAACLRLASIDETGVGPMGTGLMGLTISGDPIDPMTSPEMKGAVTAEDVAANCSDGVQMAVHYEKNPSGGFSYYCGPPGMVWEENIGRYRISGRHYVGGIDHSEVRVRQDSSYTTLIPPNNSQAIDVFGRYAGYDGSWHVWEHTHHFEPYELMPPDEDC
ncbi:type 4 pilus major pilin, partial [Sulfitobacter sp. 1A13353]|uniref:type 4 pilus major pilin n=1 Tax=Sulfitobacter sp. 1A13353 TaxID=3368568 RepID=UPI003745523D